MIDISYRMNRTTLAPIVLMVIKQKYDSCVRRIQLRHEDVRAAGQEYKGQPCQTHRRQ